MHNQLVDSFCEWNNRWFAISTRFCRKYFDQLQNLLYFLWPISGYRKIVWRFQYILNLRGEIWPFVKQWVWINFWKLCVEVMQNLWIKNTNVRYFNCAQLLYSREYFILLAMICESLTKTGCVKKKGKFSNKSICLFFIIAFRSLTVASILDLITGIVESFTTTLLKYWICSAIASE